MKEKFMADMTALIAGCELVSELTHRITQEHTLDNLPELQKATKKIRERKFEFLKVMEACESYISTVLVAFKKQGEMEDRPIDNCFIEVAALSASIQAYTFALVSATALVEGAQHNQMHVELLAILRKYQKMPRAKKNPDLFRQMFVESGATSYLCFEKGILNTYSHLNKQD